LGTRNELLTLSECSRWPEREACGQECLAQIQEAPKACLVWTIINRWYQGQNCVYCHKPFGEIHWHEHPPALLNKERKTVQWNEIPAEKLQEALETHRPVCWNCHIAQTFRREHPELVVDHEQRGEFAEMKEWASYANLFCKTQICGASRTTSSSWGFQQRRFWKPLTSGTPI